MTCKKIQSLLDAYIDGAVNQAESKAIKAHIEECEMCKRELATLEKMLKLLNELNKEEIDSVPEHLHNALREIPENKQQINYKKLTVMAALVACIAFAIYLGPFQALDNNLIRNKGNYTQFEAAPAPESNKESPQAFDEAKKEATAKDKFQDYSSEQDLSIKEECTELKIEARSGGTDTTNNSTIATPLRNTITVKVEKVEEVELLYNELIALGIDVVYSSEESLQLNDVSTELYELIIDKLETIGSIVDIDLQSGEARYYIEFQINN